MILRDAVDDFHKLLDLLIRNRNLHSLTAKHIRRSDKHWITQTVCNLFCLLCRVDCTACRARNLRLLQNLVKKFSVLCGVHVLRLCSQNWHAHLHQTLCELDCRLAAKLHHCAVRLLDVDNVLHVLRRQRLKIELVGNIKIRADCLRIIIDNDCLISRF